METIGRLQLTTTGKLNEQLLTATKTTYAITRLVREIEQKKDVQSILQVLTNTENEDIQFILKTVQEQIEKQKGDKNREKR